MPTRTSSRTCGWQHQPADDIDDRESRSDGAFGIVFMGPRIAEIGQHAVAHELCGKAVESTDRPDARVLKSPDDLPQVLRIKATRQAPTSRPYH